MGGLTTGLIARIATIAAVLCGALALGGSAAAAAESPLDAASAVSTVEQTAAAVASPTTEQAGSAVKDAASVPAPSAIRETVERAAGRAGRISPTAARPTADPDSRAATPSRESAAAVTPATHRVEGAPIGHTRGSAHKGGRHTARTSSPPHGRKAMPPARSSEERAGAARGTRAHSAAPSPQRAPRDTGLGRGARGLATPGGISFAALLIAMLAASRPFLLRRLQMPAPIARRLAYASPVGPPG